VLHALKTWPEYYKDVESGKKTFEIRKEDRPFKENDILMLQEYDPNTGYTGNELSFTITFILRDALEMGLKKGYCIIGIKPKENGY